MSKFDHNQVIRGTFGKVWLDGERMSNVKSFEAKLSYTYEDMDVNGDLVTKKRLTGMSISGTMTLFKVDSYILTKYHKLASTGETPELTIVSALDDPSNEGVERVLLTDVKLDEITLSKFENKTLTEEEVPFTAGGYEFLDMIS